MRNLTLFGIWFFIFPIQLLVVTIAVLLEYAIAVFNMPTDLWEDIVDRIEGNIDIEDDNDE